MSCSAVNRRQLEDLLAAVRSPSCRCANAQDRREWLRPRPLCEAASSARQPAARVQRRKPGRVHVEQNARERERIAERPRARLPLADQRFALRDVLRAGRHEFGAEPARHAGLERDVPRWPLSRRTEAFEDRLCRRCPHQLRSVCVGESGARQQHRVRLYERHPHDPLPDRPRRIHPSRDCDHLALSEHELAQLARARPLCERDGVAVPELGVGDGETAAASRRPRRGSARSADAAGSDATKCRASTNGSAEPVRSSASASRRCCAGASAASSAYSASARSGCAKRRAGRTCGSSRPAVVASSSALASARADTASASRSRRGSNSMPIAAAARSNRRVPAVSAAARRSSSRSMPSGAPARSSVGRPSRSNRPSPWSSRALEREEGISLGAAQRLGETAPRLDPDLCRYDHVEPRCHELPQRHDPRGRPGGQGAEVLQARFVADTGRRTDGSEDPHAAGAQRGRDEAQHGE